MSLQKEIRNTIRIIKHNEGRRIFRMAIEKIVGALAALLIAVIEDINEND